MCSYSGFISRVTPPMNRLVSRLSPSVPRGLSPSTCGSLSTLSMALRRLRFTTRWCQRPCSTCTLLTTVPVPEPVLNLEADTNTSVHVCILQQVWSPSNSAWWKNIPKLTSDGSCSLFNSAFDLMRKRTLRIERYCMCTHTEASFESNNLPQIISSSPHVLHLQSCGWQSSSWISGTETELYLKNLSD